MTVILQENFEKQLREWTNQPDADLREYQKIPPDTPVSSVQICSIDGLLWDGLPKKQVEYVAGRFLLGESEKKWIVPRNTMHQEAWLDAQLQNQGIPGGKAYLYRLNSALTEINLQDLQDRSVEIRPGGRPFRAMTISAMASCLAHYFRRG